MDPNRVPISAVIQVEDGDTWLELRSLVACASAERDGKPPPRVTAMPWTGDEQEAGRIKQTMGGELKKVPGMCGTRRIMHKQCWVTAMQHSPGPQLRAARFQIEAPKVFPTTVVRLKVDKRFVSEQTWTANVQRPAKMANEWSLRHPSFEVMRCVHGSWGWAGKSFSGGGKAIMTGLMRIDIAAMQGLFRASEMGGLLNLSGGLRNTLRHAGSRHQSSGQRESRAENLAAKLGLTLGERQIGARMGQPDGPVCFTRTWQVSGVGTIAAHRDP